VKVAIFGGTGFVGSYLVKELLAKGHDPVLMVRPGSEEKVADQLDCECVRGDIGDPVAVRRTLSSSEAAVYNIGILQEKKSLNITFKGLQLDGARAAVDAAVEMGVKRFLLMSANGVKPDGTAYQQTKYMAEQHLKSSGLDWTIFRPSVLFGDPHGRMEFATQLYRDIISSPLPAPLFYEGILPVRAGSVEMSPIHVADVAKIFVGSLEKTQAVGKTYLLGGPNSVSWKQILTTIEEATGKSVLKLPTPVWPIKILASLPGIKDLLPVTHDQITMLMEGNTCRSDEVFELFKVSPTPFDAQHLQYLKSADAFTSGT
jgi:NADH dehydrogenase